MPEFEYVPLMDTAEFAPKVWWNVKGHTLTPSLAEQIAATFNVALVTMAQVVAGLQSTTQDDFALAGPGKGSA
jgi:hypothetical protein